MTKLPCLPPSAPLLSAVGSIAILLATPAAAILEEPAADDVPPVAALCVGGTVWHAPSASCVAPALGLVSDDALYAELRRHAHAGRYTEALRLLRAMREAGTPWVLTAEGYILRRTGRVEEGLARYAEALALDPGYHLARAYLGLWHLEQGDRTGAARQLTGIEARGGRGGEAWRMLAEALGGGRVGY